MINVNKLNKILYNDFGIVLNESEVAYLNYLNNTSNKNSIGILKEFFTKCTTRHLCINKNKKDLSKINKKLISEEIGRNHHTTTPISAGESGVSNINKFLNDEKDFEIEEETDTFSGKPGLKINGKSLSFESDAEADLYSKKIANKALVKDGQLSHVKRFDGTY
tara:strand:+ start:263 stop:754 length:492 start_codon:yes stop_codon:yes gene_type:complete